MAKNGEKWRKMAYIAINLKILIHFSYHTRKQKALQNFQTTHKTFKQLTKLAKMIGYYNTGNEPSLIDFYNAKKINHTDSFTNLFNRVMPKYIKPEQKPVADDTNFGPSLKKLFKEVKQVMKLPKKDYNYGPCLRDLFKEVKAIKPIKETNYGPTLAKLFKEFRRVQRNDQVYMSEEYGYYVESLPRPLDLE